MAEESNPQPGGSDREELKGLSQANLELLSLAEELLDEFHPQAGTLSDLPQITVEPADTLQVCRIAKDHPRLGLKQLECLACVDYQDTFQLVYFLHSLEPDHTLAIKTNVPYDSPVLPSVTSVWQAADWYEREAHDLFGVVFNGHPSLAPLLLYEGFEGYPGRKEFPFHDYQEF